MKTTVEFTGAKTKREAIVTAIVEFNRRKRMADLVKYSRSTASLMTVEELRKLRRKS